jgi:hypothetical protein
LKKLDEKTKAVVGQNEGATKRKRDNKYIWLIVDFDIILFVLIVVLYI